MGGGSCKVGDVGSQRQVFPYIGTQNSHCVLKGAQCVLVRLRESLAAVSHQV